MDGAADQLGGRDQLGQEWQTLQDNHEQYETMALAVKLVAVVLCFLSFAVPVQVLLSCAVMVVLWIQEALLRTSQARLAARLLRIEATLQQASRAPVGFALYSSWQVTRSGTVDLLFEYATNAQRPTVAFPYVALLLLLVGAWWMEPG